MVKCQPSLWEKCLMISNNGKYITIKKYTRKNVAKLCTEDFNGDKNGQLFADVTVNIMRRQNQMAFFCDKGGSWYMPKVEKKTLTVQKIPQSLTDSTDGLSDSYWFEMVDLGNGEFRGLRSVTKPVQYLSISENCLSMRDDDHSCVQVKTEKIQAQELDTSEEEQTCSD